MNLSLIKQNRVALIMLLFAVLQTIASCNQSSSSLSSRTPEQNREWYKSLSPEWHKAMKEHIYLLDAPTDNDLAKMMALPKVDVHGITTIKDLEPLRPLTGLKWLDCGQTEVGSLEPIKEAKGMLKLNCDYTHIADLSPLAEFKKLQMFWCMSSSVTDLSPLSNLPALLTLNASRTLIKSIEPLRNCPKLAALTIADTPIESIAPLMDLDDIKFLDIRQTKVGAKEVNEFKKKHPNCDVKY